MNLFFVMNKIILVLVVFLLFFSFAFAEEFDPSTIRELDVSVVIEGKGSFSGEVREGDEIEVKVLTFKETENQELMGVKEELFIGGDVFNATHEEINGNAYAVFTVRDLLEYVEEPTFTYRISAGIKTNAGIGVERDYSLEKGITEFGEFTEESRFIESEDEGLREFVNENFSSDSFLVSVKEAVEWIHSNIEYDYEYYDVILPATEVFSLRKGVCDEFANLSAAFFRIKGIPVRYVVGVSFDGRKWGNHGWIEVFLPEEGWIGIDSTYEEALYVDGTHLVLAYVKDPSEAVEKVIMPERIKVELTRQDPEIEINSKTEFNGITGINVVIPEKISSGEEFELGVNAGNLTEEYLILPLSLQMHGDFSVEGENELLELFSPREKKEFNWSVAAPSVKEGSRVTYDFFVKTIDETMKEKIAVENGFEEEKKEKEEEKEKPLIDLIGEEIDFIPALILLGFVAVVLVAVFLKTKK